MPNLMPKAAWKLILIKADKSTTDLTDTARPRLISLTLAEKRGGEADQLDIVLDDSDGKLSVPKKGANLTLELGWLQGQNLPLGLINKGRFKVDEIKISGPPDVITITARSADFTDAFNVRRERHFVGQSVQTIIGAIATTHGLKPNIDPELSPKIVPALGHAAKSDAALLHALGRRFDAVATVKNATLIFCKIGTGKTASGKTIPSETIDRQNTASFSFETVDQGTHNGAKAHWHDKSTGRHAYEVAHGTGTGTPKRLRKTYASQADARHAADAENARMKRGASKMDFPLSLGRPDLYPDRPITLTGFKTELNAIKWLIVECSHTMDANGGLMTKLTLESVG